MSVRLHIRILSIKWNIHACIRAAKKAKTRGVFTTQYPGAYDACKRYGWLPIVHDLMEESQAEVWTKDELLDLAKNFSSRAEWYYEDNATYTAARRRGKVFLEQCCKHMAPSKTTRRKVRRDDGVVYKSVREAARALKASTGNVWAALTIGHKVKGHSLTYVKKAS